MFWGCPSVRPALYASTVPPSVCPFSVNISSVYGVTRYLVTWLRNFHETWHEYSLFIMWVRIADKVLTVMELKVKVRQPRPWKSCELDSSWVAEWSCTKTYATTILLREVHFSGPRIPIDLPVVRPLSVCLQLNTFFAWLSWGYQ